MARSIPSHCFFQIFKLPSVEKGPLRQQSEETHLTLPPPPLTPRPTPLPPPPRPLVSVR